MILIDPLYRLMQIQQVCLHGRALKIGSNVLLGLRYRVSHSEPAVHSPSNRSV